MKITWVNHACFIVEQGSTKLICDPWFDLPAFDNGWELISPSVLSYDAFADIDYVWFSHEHPDHFNPPNLKKIPEQYRKEITVLFQETKDRKVVAHCKNVLGFKDVIELRKGRFFDLAEGLKVLNEPWTSGDSWLYIVGDKTILNVNDCMVFTTTEANELKRRINGPVDVLMTQFSYANWTGNPEDKEAMTNAARHKLDSVRLQIEVLQPSHTIPFASYVWFAYQDNFFLNEGANTVSDCVTTISDLPTDPIVLYPGEQWDVGQPHDNTYAVERYTKDYARIEPNMPGIREPQKVELERLLKKGNEFAEKLRTFNNSLMVHAIPPVHIWLKDHDQAVQLSGKGVTSSDKPESLCSIGMNSDALMYMFSHLWGGDTININGRYYVPEQDYDRANDFWHYAFMARRNNQGMKEPLNYKMIVRSMIRRIFGI
jgi:L-ascorbate metabolism protein UlaG (beta-lactamase superfamily)